MSTDLITREMRALIGVEAGPFVAWDPVERGAVRRFAQATMDADPLHLDQAYAAGTRFAGLVAQPLFPLYLFRREPGTPDPLDAMMADPDFDGVGDVFFVRFGLPPLPITLKRFLNGGSRVRFFRYAGDGERVLARSRYVDITQKAGKSGPMILAVVHAHFATDAGEPLLDYEQTLIWR